MHALLQDIDSEGPEPSDWDKYASEEYEILVAEETANEQLHEGYDTPVAFYYQLLIKPPLSDRDLALRSVKVYLQRAFSPQVVR